MAWILGLYILTGAVFIPVWLYLSQRFDKKFVFATAISLQATILLIVFSFARKGTVTLYATCVGLAGTSFGGVSALKFSILSDVTDVEQLRAGGLRDEGKIVGLFDISAKVSSSILVALSFWMIDVAGYEAEKIPQNARAELMIRIFYALAPALLALIAAMLMLLFYPLDRARHAAVLEKLGQISNNQATCTAAGSTAIQHLHIA